MGPLAALAGALGWNYSRHRRGKPTMCSTARKHVKPAVFVVCWAVLTGWLIPHYIDGFKIALDKLTD